MPPTVKNVYDLSVTVADGDVTWCLAPNVKIRQRRTINPPDDYVNAEDLQAPVHFGTHIDFPFHMIEGGATCEVYPPIDFIGPGVFIDLEDLGEREIRSEHLKDYDIKAGDIVLINLGWWRHRGDNDVYLYDFPGLSAEAATYLADLGIKGVGSDAYCIEFIERENIKGPFPAHVALNEKDIWAIEGLDDMSEVLGRTDLTVAAFPVKLGGVGGSPARVVAIEYDA